MACNQTPDKKEQLGKIDKQNTFRLYSKNFADSFSISVNLPNDYDAQENEKYPAVYLLDANLYFDIIATTINKYSEVGLAPSVITTQLLPFSFYIHSSRQTNNQLLYLP